MSILDKLKELVTGREQQVKEGVDKAADIADEKTGGKYTDQIDTARDKIGEQLGGNEPPAEGEQQNPT
ncbi:hypothetical protein GCM10012275_49770 [Longimycelium tulufanense]|uniref:Antitoxin n=1 Tax=Longimycelium tulufanense TaxID=907463 RepID=A0A8J3FWN3_9PSEU|nr:antitoxin [Longimycelium tulufanense]GGM73194.1 hypothetical protein GCM10012275_49770 [Longimycelium tulufanense]